MRKKMMGGGMMQRPMYKSGSTVTKGNIRHGKLKSQKELKKITDSKEYKKSDFGKKTKMLNVATMAMGGRVSKMGGGMMQRPMYKKGGAAVGPKKQSEQMKKLKNKLEKKATARVLPRPDRSKNLQPLKPKPRDPKRKPNTKIFDIIGDILKTPYKIRGGNAMGGRIKKKMGGSLKSVPAGNKGLKKLPTEVRNKMGFMKKGGKVNGK